MTSGFPAPFLGVVRFDISCIRRNYRYELALAVDGQIDRHKILRPKTKRWGSVPEVELEYRHFRPAEKENE